MNLIYQNLIKSFNNFIHFEIIYNNEFLFDTRLSETFKKNFINIFVFIIETNAINSIIARFQINLKTQKYNKSLTLITNIINLKIINEIVFENHKIFIIVKINKNQRLNKIVINKLIRQNIKRYKRIMKSNLLITHYTTFTNIFLNNVLEKIHVYNDIKKLIKILLIQITHASIS